MASRSLASFPSVNNFRAACALPGRSAPSRGRVFPCLAIAVAFCLGLAASAASAAAPQNDGDPNLGPAESPYRTFAVLNSASLREKGWQNLVEFNLRRFPGAAIVDRAQLDAAVKGVSLEELIAPEAVAKRLDIGRTLKADALVIIATHYPPQLTVARPSDEVWATVVVCDCKTGLRISVEQSIIEDPNPARLNGSLPPSLAGPFDIATVVFKEVIRVRTRFATGVTCVTASPTLVNRGKAREYDHFEGQFTALLRNALSLSPGVAVVDPDEAQSIAKQPAGNNGAAPIVPLTIDGGFEASPVAPGTPGQAPGLNFAFSVSFAGGKAGARELRKTVSLADATAFLTQQVPAAALGAAPIADARVQFEDLQWKGDHAALAGKFAESVAIREAALMLRPTDTLQHWRLVDECCLASQQPATFGHPMARPADVQRFVRGKEDAWEAGLGHLEYLIRNRQIRRPAALLAVSRYRLRYSSAIPDGPPALRRFFTEVHPLVLGLEPGSATDHNYDPRLHAAPAAPAPVGLSPEQLDTDERTTWMNVFFGVAAHPIPNGPGEPLTSDSSAPGVLSDDAADMLAGMIEKWFPGDILLPDWAGHVFERVPGSDRLANLAPTTNPAQPKPPIAQDPTRAALEARREATWLHFLDRVQKSGKPPFVCWARLSRLRLQCMKERASAPQASAETRAQIDALERDYQGLRVRDHTPDPADPLFQAIDRLRVLATGASPAAPRATQARNTPKPAALTPLWYVPMPLRFATLDGKQLSRAEAPNGLPLSLRLVDGGPALDLLWTSERVFLWDTADAAHEVFNKKMVVEKLAVKRPEQFTISDVQWDGKRVWVAYTLEIYGNNGLLEFPSGLAIIEADGKTIEWVGLDDGLPPGEHGLLLHPISAGHVLAIGAFGENDRAWCAVVEPPEPGQRARVKVFHTAVKVVPPPPPDADPAAEPDHDAHTVFRPQWLAECRPVPAGGAGAAPRLLLVGRESQAYRWPLVINLDTLEVSVSANAFGQEGFYHQIEAFAGGADTLLEIHDSSMYRWALTWDGSQLSGKPSPVLEDLSLSPAFGKHLQAAGDAVYIGVARGTSEYSWMRYDLKTQQSERLVPDVLARLGGVCSEYGMSTRFGLIGLGHQVCRLVAAPDRPQEALRRKLKITPRGAAAYFEAANPPAPAASALPPGPPKPNQPAPRLDDLIAALKPDSHNLTTVAAQFAELKPEDFPPATRAEVSAALVLLLTSDRVMVYTPALKAFAVWHAPEAVPALLPFLNDRNNFVRATAMEALGMCRDPRAIPDVAARLPRDVDPALGCLIAIGPASEPAILESIHPAMQAVHERMTIDALALIGTRNSIPPLQALLEKGPDLETAEIIRQAIEMIQKREK